MLEVEVIPPPVLDGLVILSRVCSYSIHTITQSIFGELYRIESHGFFFGFTNKYKKTNFTISTYVNHVNRKAGVNVNNLTAY